MAEKLALKKVEEELNCSICLDTYSNPKLLQCFHVYCQKCLVKLVVRDQQGQLSLTCPICRQDTPVPANGVAGLQPAFQINHLLEILEEHKKATADPPASADNREESASLPPDLCKNFEVCCSEHEGKEVELYCETCGQVICWKCALKGGKHHSHDYEELDKAFEQYKMEITASLEPMEKQLTTINKALTVLDTRCGKISDQQADIESDVYATFSKLQEFLDNRKTDILSQLHSITQKKLKALALQKDQLETTQAQLHSCLGFMKESLTTGRQEEVLMMKTSVVMQVKQLTTTFPPDMLEPNTEADMAFSASSELTTACQNFGQVTTQGMPDPSQCHVTGKGTEVAVVGETSTAVLRAVNFKGQSCVEPIQPSEIELMSEITGTRTSGSIERRGQSQYEISYQPTVKGRHQLHIKMGSQHIRGSPFAVAVRSPSCKELGSQILAFGVNRPWRVVINQKGDVIVTEEGAFRVSVFSPRGDKLLSFGKHGSDQGQFECPRGVAVDGEGNILVVDAHNIQKFTADGKFLKAVGSKGNGPLQFSSPKDVAFNSSNNKVYATDTSNHRVQVLNSDLSFSSTFGKNGSGKGQFSYPSGIACDSTGNVYVADWDNHRIQVFTPEGKFLRMFGGRRSERKGELYWPEGIAIDTNDMVYITEYGNECVSVFTSGGGFVTTFGSRGGQPGQFKNPRGLAVDNSGVVYVCDGDNHRVQVF